MKNYYLSIAIPTYNRINYVDESIENILKQIIDAELENDICIDVFDNCSKDNTYHILKKKYEHNENVFIHQSDSNKGADVNIQRCIYNSSSERYVWLLSDDDVVLDGSISKIYSKIKEDSEISLFYLNMCTFKGDFDPKMETVPKFKLDKDMVTNDINAFINFLGIWITFLSSIVINKQYLINKDTSDRFIGTHFIQTHVALNNLKNNRYAMITKDAIIACRGGNTGGYNLYYVWVEQYKKILTNTAVDCGASFKMCQDIFENSVCSTIKSLVIDMRSRDTKFEDKNRFILFKNTFMYPKVYFHLYPYVYCPKFILKAIRKMRRSFR